MDTKTEPSSRIELSQQYDDLNHQLNDERRLCDWDEVKLTLQEMHLVAEKLNLL